MKNIMNIFPDNNEKKLIELEKYLQKEEQKLIIMGEEQCRQRRSYHLKRFLRIKEYNHDLPLHKYCLNNRVQPSDYDWLCNEIDKKIKKDDI